MDVSDILSPLNEAQRDAVAAENQKHACPRGGRQR